MMQWTRMASANISSSRTRKPLVVLAGWMGCQPKHLRRYADLYESLGCNVISRIAAPAWVVEANLNAPAGPVAAATWPHKTPTPYDLSSLAWDTLAEVHAQRFHSPLVLFHVLSNGGCFLWEQISRILHAAQSRDVASRSHVAMTADATTPVMPEPVQNALRDIRHSTVGVVFDSCPGFDLRRLSKALAYCTWAERLDVVRHNGVDALWLSRPVVQGRLYARSQDYRKNLQDIGACALPQLYMYGVDDPLAAVQDVDAMVDFWRSTLGPEMVWRRKWEHSAHVAHLLHHPDDYRSTVVEFLEHVMDGMAAGGDSRSKL